jgi:hypothetical protein
MVSNHVYPTFLTINQSHYLFLLGADDIKNSCNLIRNALSDTEEWQVGLDREWGTIDNARGLITGSK